MFYDMHIGFAVRARRLENAAGRSNIKKTQQRRIDPDLRVPSIVTKANIPLENILIDKNDKENGVSLWLHENILHIFETNANLFPKYFLLLFLSLSIRKLSNELKRKLEIQQGRRRISRTRRKSGEICTKVALIPRIIQENTHAARFIRGSNYFDYPLHRWTFVHFDWTSSFPPANYNDRRFYIESVLLIAATIPKMFPRRSHGWGCNTIRSSRSNFFILIGHNFNNRWNHGYLSIRKW